MGRIYENIEIDGKKVRVKVDTGSDFPLALKGDVIRKLKLKKHPTAKALLFTEEGPIIKSPVLETARSPEKVVITLSKGKLENN